MPDTVRLAFAEVPAAMRLAVPRTTPALVNNTLPVGRALPVAGFTVTFNDVVPPEPIVAGLAVTVRVVGLAGAATVMVTGAETEEANAAEPA